MYDVIVVGAGIIGSWTAYHLAIQKYNVLLLDQFSLPHSRGSSQGHARLTKRSHRKHYCSELIPEAMRHWASLERVSGTELVLHTGHLTIAEKESTGELISRMKHYMDQNDVRYTSYAGHEIGANFLGMDFDDNFSAYFEDNGAVLKADKCLQTIWKEFRDLGGTILDEEKVLAIKPINENNVTAETNKGVYSSKSVVLACGPWIAEVMRDLDVQVPAQAATVKVHYWKIRDSYSRRAKYDFPFMVYMSGYHVYSTPDYEYPGMVKVCYHHRVSADPDARDRRPSDKDNELAAKRFAVLKNLVAKHLSYLEPEPTITETFLQTMTPDSDFILDYHPLHKNIILGAGFSGHGFGPAPTIGKILANLATSQQQDYDLRPFSLNRKYKQPRL